MSEFCKVVISQERINAAEAQLVKLPFEVRSKVLGKALHAAAAPIVKWAKLLAPDSVKTGTRVLWSKSVAANRAGKPGLSETIVKVIRSYGSIDAIYVGPSWPAGNIINVIANPHRRTYWGKFTRLSIVPPNLFMQHAAELTRGDQGSNFTNTIQKESDRIISQMARLAL